MRRWRQTLCWRCSPTRTASTKQTSTSARRKVGLSSPGLYGKEDERRVHAQSAIIHPAGDPAGPHRLLPRGYERRGWRQRHVQRQLQWQRYRNDDRRDNWRPRLGPPDLSHGRQLRQRQRLRRRLLRQRDLRRVFSLRGCVLAAELERPVPSGDRLHGRADCPGLSVLQGRSQRKVQLPRLPSLCPFLRFRRMRMHQDGFVEAQVAARSWSSCQRP
jgi:hypothetical protein